VAIKKIGAMHGDAQSDILGGGMVVFMVLFVVMVLILSTVLIITMSPEFQNEIIHKQKIQITELKKDLERTKEEKQEALKKVQSLETQVANLKKQVERLADKNESLAKLNKALEAKNKRLTQEKQEAEQEARRAAGEGSKGKVTFDKTSYDMFTWNMDNDAILTETQWRVVGGQNRLYIKYRCSKSDHDDFLLPGKSGSGSGGMKKVGTVAN